MPLRITTWNVNGIRNPFGYQPWRENRTFQAMFDTLEADIVVMQETKIQRKDLRDDMVLVPGWDVFFSLPKYKKGYSGVAVYTRSSKCCPIRAEEGITGALCPPNSSTKFRDLPADQQIGGYPAPGQLSDSVDEQTLDSEGRCVILEFPAFVLIGVYSPATRDETRTEFREAYIDAVDVRVRNLVAMGKQVFLCGDLNIVRSELDTAGLAERLRKEAMTLDDFFATPSRRIFNHLVFGGHGTGERDAGREEPVLWDLCREYHPARAGMYTCWDTKKNARPGNFGSRIDYVLCSSGLKDWFIDSNIQEGLLGSDHCPVYATVGETVSFDGSKIPIEDIMNPTGMFKDGERQREWSPKDLLPTSAKLIPEFDRRQNIRDMFFKKAMPSAKIPKPAAASPQGTPSAANTPVSEVNNNEPQKDSIVSASQSSSRTTALATVTRTASSNNTSITSPQKPPPPKRQAGSSMSPGRPQKKGKVALGRENSTKSTPGFSQSSLKGFFKPKTPTPGTNPLTETGSITDTPTTPNNASAKPTPKQDRRPGEPSSTPVTGNDTQNAVDESPKPESASAEKVFDPIEAKESWSKLLGKRVVPRCEHGDDCQMLVTKKAGVNCGTSFFMCARPLGPSGDKEQGTEFRCGTFIWSSDWNGRQ
ncbi:Endonuclease/exonuclease/phosphatase [Parachaetomium inaequale]|uniref:DNA-(apurinic or apyrimidinic site) endonuclease 2 n=1 Tax=Parachaetomium inaequale TaxID=2588326 RepID=A0AAN6PLH8_9PEZI|nr:Endonuclease/exonuclease/phosphatase [Parachaetomium inaequale]